MLGPLRVEVRGGPADLGGPRQRTLLARLVLACGEVVSTDRLIEDLWAGDPPPKALAALQAHISYLRRALEPDRPRRAPAAVLVSEAPGYALRLPTAAVDAWHFERLLGRAADAGTAERYRVLGAALALWSGEPYAAFADSAWVAPEVARLTELHHRARERLAECALDLGRPDEAVDLLDRAVAEHPDREDAARLLALARYRLGRQPEALATLRHVREHLDAEFGIVPGPALRALELAMLNHAPELDFRPETSGARAAPPRDDAAPVGDPDDRAAAPPGAEPGPADPAADHRLRAAAGPVGYEAERAALPAEADRVVAGRRARVVWIEGEAGAGKSTLVGSAAAASAAAGWRVAVAACPEVDGAPAAWVWQQLLAALDADTGADRSPFALAHAVREACLRHLASGPVLLVLEDVHRADSATLQILRQVAAWLGGEPVLLVVTLRGSEADAQVEATAAALASLTGERLVLGGLDPVAVGRVAEAAGLAGIDADTAAYLHARTGGNPLFVREVARLAASVGDLHAVPDGVRHVLARRIARLPAGAARALRMAAVWGEEIGFDALLDLTGDTEEELADLVDTVTVAGLVRLDRRGRIGFAHALIRDAVYGDIPVLRRARLHWHALELLERRHGLDPARLAAPRGGADWADWSVLDALAHHAVEGSVAVAPERALPYVVAAAAHSGARHAHQEAAPLWRAALDLHVRAGHEDPSAARADRLAALDARCALVDALAHGGNDEEARALRTAALATARALGAERAAASGDVSWVAGRVTAAEDPVLAVLTAWRAPTIWTTRRRGLPEDELVAALLAALDRVPAGPVRVRLLVTTVFEVEGADDERAFLYSAQALALARELGDPELLCAALNARAFVSLGPDLWADRAPLAAELLEVARAAGLPEFEAVARFLLFLVAAGEGALVRARAEIDRAVACGSGGQLGPLLVVSTAFRAVLAVLRGDHDTVRTVLAGLAAHMTASGHANGEELRMVGEMQIGWAEGDLSGALEVYAAMYEAAPSVIAYVYALALLDAGDAAGAARVVERGHPVLRDYYWSAMSMFAARVAARLGDTARARRHYEDLLCRAGTIGGLDSGSVALGPVDSVLAELADALGDPAAAAAHRRDADRVRVRIAAELAACDAAYPAG
ncbi:BTAD domain-containing putative transcriptional regulator [Nocardia thailandica]|uniref:BTAD domain-containing putative transcriptional regulator n=1 Tax=Nocardia thailandica TaxID=257275 RepID=A0ABW6PJW4_9NOCA